MCREVRRRRKKVVIHDGGRLAKPREATLVVVSRKGPATREEIGFNPPGILHGITPFI
jgi:hypothetical protein